MKLCKKLLFLALELKNLEHLGSKNTYQLKKIRTLAHLRNITFGMLFISKNATVSLRREKIASGTNYKTSIMPMNFILIV